MFSAGGIFLSVVALHLHVRCHGGLPPSSPTQCNLILKNACHQYRETGKHNVICREYPPYHFCQQTCNSASCRLRCHASISCVQQCVAGHCEDMFCTSENCNQSCIRGNCQGMNCAAKNCEQNCYTGGCEMVCSNDAERCIQSCKEGKCLMRCPLSVKLCQQKCEGGMCTMICEAERCEQSCDRGLCIYSMKALSDGSEATHPGPRHLNCNQGTVKDTCIQTCPEGHCELKYKYSRHASLLQLCSGGNCQFECSAPLKCTQVCSGGACKRYMCNSKLCIQECIAGGCNMECEAERCLQTCRGGDCSMRCLSKVKECLQWCPAGNCVLGCSARHCKHYCVPGSCVVSSRAAKLKGILRTVRCSTGTQECHQECPPKRNCAFLNWVYFGAFHSIYQSCNHGGCNIMHCITSNKCAQTCHEGACKSMVCMAGKCLQQCEGANCNMECNSRHCTQVCHGGGCRMKCTGNVEACNQSCNSQILNCETVCLAKSCTLTLL